MASIKIVRTPQGEAPLSIREAWIGCILPLPKEAGRQRGKRRALGVLSGEKRPWLARLFGDRTIDGYPVRVLDALQVLERADLYAARWWRENTPHMVAGNRFFIFDAAACEEIADDD